MNDDLILRARLDAQGHSSEDIVKILGQSKLPGGGVMTKLPFVGGAIHRNRTGMDKDQYNQQAGALKTGKQQQALNATNSAIQNKGGIQTLPQTTPGMNQPTGIAGAEGQDQTLAQLGQSQITPDNSVTGSDAQADKVKTETTMGADGEVAETKTIETMNANADTTGEGNTETGGGAPNPNAGATDATSQDATGQGATTQTAPQQQQAQGQGGVSNQVQDMAQQFQSAQDMQTIQQGQGGDKQSWLKNRSGMGKLMDIASFGATSRFGSTGGAARGKANQQSQQQTKNYQAANQRMNQRAMGMSAPMPIATSFDSQLTAYSDILSLRKSIQERNTTTNLRR